MNDRRNVIVMFLLIMLSFAIITEVSAASEAEINGTGSSPPVMSHDINQHDIASERYNENQMQDHFEEDDFQSHDGQKSFYKTPVDSGDNQSNEILYEHDMDFKPVGDSKDLNQSPEFKFDDYKSNGVFDGFKPMDNVSDDMSDKKHLNMVDFMFNGNHMGNFTSSDLKNNNFTDLPKNSELMSDVVSNLMGLNNIAPNFKKQDRNVSPNIITNQKSMDEKNNESAPFISDGKNPSDNGSFSIDKNTKTQKTVKKAKLAKKSNKKVKSIKKPKKVIKKLPKKFKKERAKL
ncbi:MAG: hypothetical protein IJ287_08915 [Methanobrevibacter sp.]|nr:hypothetical protein [Methanobrevibacter sp.]